MICLGAVRTVRTLGLEKNGQIRGTSGAVQSGQLRHYGANATSKTRFHQIDHRRME